MNEIRKQPRQNSEKLQKKCPSTNTFRVTTFRKNLFFSIFAQKSLLSKKPPRICIIDGHTPKLSADDLK